MTDTFETLKTMLPEGATATMHRGVLTVTGFRNSKLLTADVGSKKAWTDGDIEYLNVIVRSVRRAMEKSDVGIYRQRIS